MALVHGKNFRENSIMIRSLHRVADDCLRSLFDVFTPMHSQVFFLATNLLAVACSFVASEARAKPPSGRYGAKPSSKPETAIVNPAPAPAPMPTASPDPAVEEAPAFKCPDGWTKVSDPGGVPFKGPMYTEPGMLGTVDAIFFKGYLWTRVRYDDFKWSDTGLATSSNCGVAHSFTAALSISKTHTANVGIAAGLGKSFELSFGYQFSCENGKGVENQITVGPEKHKQFYGRFLILTAYQQTQKKTSDDDAGNIPKKGYDWQNWTDLSNGNIYFNHPGWLICSRRCD